MSTLQRNARCPVCRKPVQPRSRNPDFPFCSARCRRVDLGRWFGEEYRVAAREEEGEVQPSADEPPDR